MNIIRRRVLLFSVLFFFIFLTIGAGGEGAGAVKTAAATDASTASTTNILRQVNLESGERVTFLEDDTYQIVLSDNTVSRALPVQTDIKLRYQQFDPVKSTPRLTERSQVGQSDVYIVQFITAPLQSYRDEIMRLGGEIYTYVPEHAYLIKMNERTASGVAELPFVRWVGEYHADYKLDTEIARSIESRSLDGATRYSMMVLNNGEAMQKAVAEKIETIGGDVHFVNPVGYRMEATLTPAQLDQVLAMGEILFVDLWSEPEPDIDKARTVSGANYVESVQNYRGQGVRGEVLDDGIYQQHQQFQANNPIIRSDNGENGHGTPVYGIVFASGSGNSSMRGIMPEGQGIFASYITEDFFDNSGARYNHTQQLVNPSGSYRAVFQTNSWGNNRTTQYTTISAEMDDIIFNYDITILNSQSNTGNQNSRPQAWAKNIVSVGAFNHYDNTNSGDDRWNYGGSIGPASDGRIKPDLAHFFDDTQTTSSNGGYTYSFGGTSGATPITAGYFGLFYQMWADGVFEGTPGLGRDVFNSRPHNTTAKAVMINSAYRYSFSGSNADMTRTHIGWGRASAQNAYDWAVDGDMPLIIDETDVLTPFSSKLYDLEITNSGCDLRTTMVFSDPMGNPSASQHRVNDLSMRLTSPNGTIYWGNNGLRDDNTSTSGGSSNQIDTVENILLENVQTGFWQLEIFADEINQDSHTETSALDADYALVVSGDCVQVGPPPPAATGTGVIDYAWWNGISGSSVSDLTSNNNYPDNPSGNSNPADFEAPTNWNDNFGARIAGCLVAPISGNYKFWIASDDASTLSLGANDDPTTKTAIASVPQWTSPKEWEKYSQQESSYIYLQAGQSYYIEAVMKEEAGGDNLAVAWEMPGYSRRVISGDYFTPCARRFTGKVWYDNNADGIQNNGEPPITGVQVRLYDNNGNNLQTKTVGSDGSYRFDDYALGNYRIEVRTGTLPTGLEPTYDPDGTGSANQTNETLVASEISDNQDFGYRFTGKLTGRVYRDDNGNQAPSSGEPGIVTTVYLYDGDGNYLDQVISNSGGYYTFDYLPPNDYQIYILPNNLPNGAVPTTDEDGIGTPNVIAKTVGAGEQSTGQDFGYQVTLVSVGNRVWFDDIQNGVFDNGEEGLSGVEVKLIPLGEVSQPPLTTYTDSNGYYLFDGIEEGYYIIVLPGSNFEEGGVYPRFTSTNGNGVEEPLPDTNIDNDDNSYAIGNLDVKTEPIFLTRGSEPSGESSTGLSPTVPDVNANMTIDFGIVLAQD